MTQYLLFNASGGVQGVVANPQDMTQPALAGLTQVEVADDDPRIAAYKAAQFAALQAKPTPRQWLERLAPATQAAITKAAIADASGAVLLLLLKAAGNPAIDVTLPETRQGVAALLAAGAITQADATILLTP